MTTAKTKTKTKTKVYVVINESVWPTVVVGVFSKRALALAAAKKERAKYGGRLYRLSRHMVDNSAWFVGM